MVNEGPDVDARRACLLAWTVSALHASGGLGDCFLLGHDPVVEVPGPISVDSLGVPLEPDFIFLTVMLPVLGADNLGGVEVGGHIADNILGDTGFELGEPEVEQASGKNDSIHKCNTKYDK